MKYQICVSGAAEGSTIQPSHQLAYNVGQAIAKSGKTLTTGATVGLPWFAAKGFSAVENRQGTSIGFSPASSFREHVSVYRLPTMVFDYINFTGLNYVGRNGYLVRSSDAVITVGGRMGSLNELTTALECNKVVGVLLGSGGLADFVPTLMKSIKAPDLHQVIYETDPDRLVKKVVQELDKFYADFKYTNAEEERRVHSHYSKDIL